MMRRAIVAAAIVAAGLAVDVSPAVAVAVSAPGVPAAAAPCRTEDSNGCVWDARHRGDGTGRSWYASPDGVVTYIGHKRAHRMVRAWRSAQCVRLAPKVSTCASWDAEGGR
jgi:hypothetical protein